MDKESQVLFARALDDIHTVEEKFRKIQDNPAFYGAENGLSKHQLEILDKLISLVGEVSLATDELCRKV